MSQLYGKQYAQYWKVNHFVSESSVINVPDYKLANSRLQIKANTEHYTSEHKATRYIRRGNKQSLFDYVITLGRCSAKISGALGDIK